MTSRAIWDLQPSWSRSSRRAWKQPDDGIWEVRGPRRHFTHSKVMAWVAIDRAVRTLEDVADPRGPARPVAGAARRDPRRGVREGLQPGEAGLHPVLRLGRARRQPPHDARSSGSCRPRTRGSSPPSRPSSASSIDDGFVLRYRTSDDGEVDGLTGREGAFLACSFWLADCLHMIGRRDDARPSSSACSRCATTSASSAEEYDPVAERPGRQLPPGLLPRLARQHRLSAERARLPEPPTAERQDRQSRVAALGAPMVTLGTADAGTRGACGRAGRVASDNRTRPHGDRAARAGPGRIDAGPSAGAPTEEDAMKALTVVPLKAGTAALSDVDEPPESDGSRCWSRPSRSASAGPTPRSSRAPTAGPRRAGSGSSSVTSRSGGSSRRRPVPPWRRGTSSSGSCAARTRCRATNCAVGEWDFCRNGQYTEHGIKEHDGFLSERYRIAAGLRREDRPVARRLLGVLLEPTSVVAKAWEQVERIGNRAHWEPKTAVVTGAGPVGLLAALLGVQRGLEVHVIDQMDDRPQARPGSALGRPLPHRRDRGRRARRPTSSSSAPGSARSSSTRSSTSARAGSSA